MVTKLGQFTFFVVQNSLTNQFYQKKLKFLDIFNNNKKVQNLNGEKGLGMTSRFFSSSCKYQET